MMKNWQENLPDTDFVTTKIQVQLFHKFILFN